MMHTHQWTEPDHGDRFVIDGLAIGTCYWPQPPGFEHRAWTAWYADDEPDDFGDMPAVGYGSTQERAIANLLFRFPREDY